MRPFALFALLPIACQPAVEVVRPAKVAAAPQASIEPAPLPRARATRCVAEPATIYGQEEVVFRIEGEGLPNATVDTELRDERQRAISKGSVTVPGQLRPPSLPSGDFVLIVGSKQGRAGASRLVSCAVTVNRELSRATQVVH